jgi:hypothetical protein
MIQASIPTPNHSKYTTKISDFLPLLRDTRRANSRRKGEMRVGRDVREIGAPSSI